MLHTTIVRKCNKYIRNGQYVKLENIANRCSSISISIQTRLWNGQSNFEGYFMAVIATVLYSKVGFST
jgi:hypothetical protein